MKLVLSAVCCVVAFATGAQTVLFSEDFESGFSQTWKIVVQDSLTPDPTLAAYAPGWIVTQDRVSAEDSVVGSCSFFSPAGTADRWLISPQISLGALDNQLSWRAHSVDPSFPERYSVLLSTTGDDPEDFTTELLLVTAETPDWFTYTISLSDLSFVSQNIHIAFVLQTNDAYVLELDDIEVIEQPLAGINSVEKTHFSLFPNPANEVLQIVSEFEVEQVTVSDLSGKSLINATQTASIEVASLQTGMYLISVYAGNEWKTMPFLKN